jgi:hypothetical protein
MRAADQQILFRDALEPRLGISVNPNEVSAMADALLRRAILLEQVTEVGRRQKTHIGG